MKLKVEPHLIFKNKSQNPKFYTRIITPTFASELTKKVETAPGLMTAQKSRIILSRTMTVMKKKTENT